MVTFLDDMGYCQFNKRYNSLFPISSWNKIGFILYLTERLFDLTRYCNVIMYRLWHTCSDHMINKLVNFLSQFLLYFWWWRLGVFMICFINESVGSLCNINGSDLQYMKMMIFHPVVEKLNINKIRNAWSHSLFFILQTQYRYKWLINHLKHSIEITY